MRILAFSDLHCDLERAGALRERSDHFDLLIGAGDFASQHRGLEETIAALAAISTPTLLVPGNNETEAALRSACAEWAAATVLHGESAEVAGVTFFGLGGGIPVTPWEWSFDLDEDAAASALAGCPAGALLVAHSPPFGHCDSDSRGESLGSRSIAASIEDKQPPLVVCGHIHDSWGRRSRSGSSEIVNLGPDGTELVV
jgi:uncharacterized protein